MRLRPMTFVLALAVAACDDASGPNISGLDPIAISRVELEPALDTIEVLEPFGPEHSVHLFATVVMKSGVSRNDVVLAWRSSDPTVAIVDETGRVRAVGFGSTTITASAGKAGTAEIVVVPAPLATVPPPEPLPALVPPPGSAGAAP